MADDITRNLMETAVEQVKNLARGGEIRTIFPSGIESIEWDASSPSSSSGARVSLKIIRAATPVAAVSTADSDTDGFLRPLFNSEGHHVVAYVMRDDLQARAPNTLKKVMDILKAADRLLPEAATFPDDIKDQHPETKPFHYVDFVFRDNDASIPPVPSEPHVLSKMVEYTTSLKAGNGDAQSIADALSWLIHLFGDVHQPLHCIDHISALHPTGDQGGNAFKLRGNPGKLHALWDSSVSVLQNIDEELLAKQIAAQNPRASLSADLAVAAPEAWARNGFELAKTYAYGPLTENPAAPPAPSKAYLLKMESVGQRQAVLAGYRLADRLIEILA
jgi:S1/P1 Nuclease